MSTTFAQAVINQDARTTNGMAAFKTTSSAVTDLFYKIGAMRGKDVIPAFVAAYVENPELAVRVALWARDIRGGAGERKIFRDILNYLAKNESDVAVRVLNKVPELGRFDDLLAVSRETLGVRQAGFEIIKNALDNGNGLAAKWMPRQGDDAVELRSYLGWSPKRYRKTLVNLTQVVETQMCENSWDDINFNHVPSVAASRYKKAFNRHTPKYKEWVEKLMKGDADVKVNAGAVYPYDVLKGLIKHYDRNKLSETELSALTAQWDALPNYVGDNNVLPLVDVSGSMTCKAGGYSSKSQTTCLKVAVSLGLYCADKNTGPFKDTFLTFSERTELLHLKGNIIQKIKQMISSSWNMNTNLHAAFERILEVAKDGGVSRQNMPQVLLIMSDMQFDCCVQFDDNAMKMIERKYKAAGYDLPKIVFWNLNDGGNVPVQEGKAGTALVSGFSPSILKSILSGNLDDITPQAIMLKTILQDKYAY
jgi:hypothetical protein